MQLRVPSWLEYINRGGHGVVFIFYCLAHS